MSSYKVLGWSGDEARLKHYTVSGGKGGKATIKIEIEVANSFALASIVRSLSDMDAAQQVEAREAVRAAKAAATRPVKKIDKAPELLQLTYRGED